MKLVRYIMYMKNVAALVSEIISLLLFFDVCCTCSLTLCLLAATSCLLITFANSLDPDQDRKVGPDLDSNRLSFDTLIG